MNFDNTEYTKEEYELLLSIADEISSACLKIERFPMTAELLAELIMLGRSYKKTVTDMANRKYYGG